jgi:serine/threonine protein kinase
MAALAHGQSLSQRFALIRPLGKGGMGEVWLVHDHELDEQVVAKIVPPAAPEDRVELLRRECRHARRLVHPNIVRVYDFHREEGSSFITMAYIEGEDIGQFRGCSPAELLELALPVADALDYAHRQGVVHRDLKATNILVDSTGQPHVVDFGIAGLIAPQSDRLALSGGGSPHSASPQQLAGEEPRPSDDIYAFGTLLCDLIGDHPPHSVPQELSSLVAALLSKNPSDRPANMAEVKEALESVRKKLTQKETPAKGTPVPVSLVPPPRVGKINPVLPPAWPHEEPRVSTARGVGWMTIGTFGVLLLAAFVVFFFLPRWVQDRRSSADSVAPPHTAEEVESPTERPSAPPDDLRQQAELKQRAEELRDIAIRWHDDLEAKSVSLWDGDEYRAASASLDVGDQQLDAKDYRRATEAYQQAIGQFEAINARATEVVREALTEGRRALESGDASSATAAFELVASIEPGNRAATTGLERARVLNDVLSLLAEGEERERKGDVTRAVQSYQKAISLDPLSQTARQALARANARLTEDAFTMAMSEAVAALNRRDYRGARDAFQRANGIKPNQPQVADGLAQAEEGLRLEEIAEHREKALAFEKEEEWHEAAEQYQAVLKLDSTIRFAQDGKARCDKRADLSDRLEFHLKNPQRLSDEKVLEDASAFLDAASQIEPAGPRLDKQREGLAELVAQFSTPVRVYLESDNMTEVVVYRVGRLGRFEHRALDLRPGTYTVVGTRHGYRDVRRHLVVEADKDPKPLVVRCEEKI